MVNVRPGWSRHRGHLYKSSEDGRLLAEGTRCSSRIHGATHSTDPPASCTAEGCLVSTCILPPFALVLRDLSSALVPAAPASEGTALERLPSLNDSRGGPSCLPPVTPSQTPAMEMTAATVRRLLRTCALNCSTLARRWAVYSSGRILTRATPMKY